MNQKDKFEPKAIVERMGYIKYKISSVKFKIASQP